MKWFVLGIAVAGIVAGGLALAAWQEGVQQTTANSSAMIYRGNLQRTGLYHATGVRQFHEVAWTSAPPNSPCQPPGIYQDEVYVGCGGWGLYALDIQTGQEKWRIGPPSHLICHFRCDESEADEWRSKALGIHTPMTIVDGLLYFGSNLMVQRQDKARGLSEEWRNIVAVVDPVAQKLVSEFKSEPGYHLDASPVVVDGVVYFMDGLDVVAWDTTTDTEKWRLKTVKGHRSPPVPATENGILYINTGDVPTSHSRGFPGYLVAIDMESGKDVWHVPTWMGSSPVVAEGLVFVQTRGVYMTDTPPRVTNELFLVALDAKTGAERWRVEGALGVPSVADGVVYVSSVAVREDTEAQAKYVYLQALDARTGREKWKLELGEEVTEITYLSPISIANGALYFWSKAEDDARMHAIDIATRQQLWSYAPGDEDAVRWLEFGPVITDGMVFFTAWDRVYAIR